MGGLTERLIDSCTVRLAAGSRPRAALADARGTLPDIAAMSVPGLGGTAGTWRLIPTRPARLVLLNMKSPRGSLNVAMKVNGDVVAEGTPPVSVPIAFTATDCLDIGISLGSALSPNYYDKKPFKFNSTIERVHVGYADVKAPAGVG